MADAKKWMSLRGWRSRNPKTYRSRSTDDERGGCGGSQEKPRRSTHSGRAKVDLPRPTAPAAYRQEAEPYLEPYSCLKPVEEIPDGAFVSMGESVQHARALSHTSIDAKRGVWCCCVHVRNCFSVYALVIYYCL